MKKIFILLFSICLSIFSFAQTKITSGNVNLRASSEIGENKICVIPSGTVVTIVPDAITSEGWTKIIYAGKSGYVYTSFLKDVSGNNRTKHYINTKGEKVQSPTYYKSPPAGATAECNDGTYSFSRSRRGTCSHHGGVKRWL